MSLVLFFFLKKLIQLEWKQLMISFQYLILAERNLVTKGFVDYFGWQILTFCQTKNFPICWTPKKLIFSMTQCKTKCVVHSIWYILQFLCNIFCSVLQKWLFSTCLDPIINEMDIIMQGKWKIEVFTIDSQVG